MGCFSSAGMYNSNPERFDRSNSPGMDEIGEILLPQYLVDEIVNDVNVEVLCQEADMDCYLSRKEMQLEVKGENGEFQLGDIQVSGFASGGVGNNGEEDHSRAVKRTQNIGMSSFEMKGSHPGRVRNKRCRKHLHNDSSEFAVRKEKRKIANRVSAAKAHAFKQAQLETLESKVMTLKRENMLTEMSLQFLKSIPIESTSRFQLRRISSL